MPAFSRRPARGVVLVTRPLRTVRDFCRLILPTLQCARRSAFAAAFNFMPLVFGTLHLTITGGDSGGGGGDGL